MFLRSKISRMLPYMGHSLGSDGLSYIPISSVETWLLKITEVVLKITTFILVVIRYL